MKKVFILFIFTCLATLSAMAQMNDDSVVQYAREGLQKGKSQQTIYRELMAKGVTKDQLLRIRQNVQDKKSLTPRKTDSDWVVRRTDSEDSAADSVKQAGDERKDHEYKLNEGKNSIKVFGRDIFRTKNLTFEPSTNTATPRNYRLGPGDEVTIEVWGASENKIAQKISPDGYINVPEVGPISLNGLTVEAASSRIKAKLSKIYSGITSTNVDLSTNVRVSVGQIRTIQINIMGEVQNPGTYAVSSFSTAFHALYKAGGVSDIGSLRKIRVVRGGRTVSVIDVYDYILHGRSHDDIRLEEGDVVLVSPYESLVCITGNVKRPMYYEMKKGETLATLISYAGGFSSNAYERNITIERNDGVEKSVSSIGEMEYSQFALKDGDMIDIGGILDRYSNRVEIKGAVYRPGFYELGRESNTVRTLIEKADGLLDEAFLNRAILHRENPDRTLEVVSVDLRGIMDNSSPDIALHKNDVLFIPSIHDLKDRGEVEIFGEVFSPGKYPFADNTKLEDLIIQAGGLCESASTVKVDVARRIVDPTGKKKKKEIAQTYTFALKDGFVIDGEAGFKLEPYDQVFVRRSPGYSPQINVEVSGEVEFEGQYSMSERNERISDLVKKAGGLSDFAYVKGARLERQMTDNEYQMTLDLMQTAKAQSTEEDDSLIINPSTIKRVYNVAIDLEKAMANPGSNHDLALREGDQLIIPLYNNTVQVRGNVRMPNAITYDSKYNLKDYISEAGGYADRTKKSDIFILYPNGHIKRVGSHASARKIEPGCEIIVPKKGKSAWNIATTLSTVTSSVSALALIASVITNLTK